MNLNDHDDDLLLRFVVGLVTYEEAIHAAHSKDKLRVAIKLYLTPTWLDDVADDGEPGLESKPINPKKPSPSLGSEAKPPEANGDI